MSMFDMYESYVVQGLILDDASVNYQDKNGSTPLHIACEENHVDAVKV